MSTPVPTLGSFCKFQSGVAFPEPLQGKKNGDFPFIKVSDMKLRANRSKIIVANNWLDQAEAESIGAKPVPVGSIVFAKIGLGLYSNRMRLITQPTLIDNNMLAAIPNENITSSELYSILLRIDMATWAIGAALPYLRTSDLAKVPLDHIDFGELPSTANIIESLSLLEDENFAKISLMNEISQVFFHQWFQKVDRENLPIGWEMGKLSDLARLSKLTINPQKFPQKEFLHYSIPAFDSGLGPDVTLGADIHSNKFTIQEKCVLLSKLNPRTCRVWVSSTSSEITSICSTEFLPLIPNEEVPIAYLYHLLTSPSFRWLLKSWVTGTTNSHQRVRPEEVMNLPCVIPPVNIMKRFGEFSSSELNLSSSTLEQDKTSSEVKFQFL